MSLGKNYQSLYEEDLKIPSSDTVTLLSFEKAI